VSFLHGVSLHHKTKKEAVMKKLSLFLIVVFLISIGSSFQQVAAQEKTKEELEQELKIQQAIDEQKKVYSEQKKAQADAEAAIEEQYAVKLDKAMKDIDVQVKSSGRAGDAQGNFNRKANRFFSNDGQFLWASPEMEVFYDHGMGGDSERMSWDFSRSVKEKSFTKDYSFDVEKTVNTVVMSVMGDCKAGEIRIKIQMPNGKTYSDIVIDEFGNLNWRKSFTISETENQDKAGEWKFKIDSNKATGYFKISLQTF
jgi:hypothetical protein